MIRRFLMVAIWIGLASVAAGQTATPTATSTPTPTPTLVGYRVLGIEAGGTQPRAMSGAVVRGGGALEVTTLTATSISPWPTPMTMPEYAPLEVTGTGLFVGDIVTATGETAVVLASRGAVESGPTAVITADLGGGVYQAVTSGQAQVRLTGTGVAAASRMQLSAVDGVAEVAGGELDSGEYAFEVGVALSAGGGGLVLCDVRFNALPWVKWE